MNVLKLNNSLWLGRYKCGTTDYNFKSWELGVILDADIDLQPIVV